MCEKKLKECKFCRNNTLLVEFLGFNPKTGNRLFSVVCIVGCTNYVYSFNSKTKKYMRTGNLDNLNKLKKDI